MSFGPFGSLSGQNFGSREGSSDTAPLLSNFWTCEKPRGPESLALSLRVAQGLGPDLGMQGPVPWSWDVGQCQSTNPPILARGAGWRRHKDMALILAHRGGYWGPTGCIVGLWDPILACRSRVGPDPGMVCVQSSLWASPAPHICPVEPKGWASLYQNSCFGMTAKVLLGTVQDCLFVQAFVESFWYL